MELTDEILLIWARLMGFLGLHLTKLGKKRINKLIKLMKTESAGNMFDMTYWYLIPKGCKVPEEAILHEGTCGTTACIAGFAGLCDPDYFAVATSDPNNLFPGVGLLQRNGDKSNSGAFGAWLNLPFTVADALCAPKSRLWRNHDRRDINHAIKLLEAYRDGGIRKCYAVG